MNHRLTVRHSVRAVVSDLSIFLWRNIGRSYINTNSAYDHRV